jgi:hypothetical protein
MPRLLARCAACVAAGTPYGRPPPRMKKPPAKPCPKLERARVTLQIIFTWAKFRNGEAFNRLDVLRLVEKTLREMK